jgi:ATP-dependent helicase/nuclease subunit B
MSVRFIIGRAGSGKTRYCFDSVVRDCRQNPLGPPIYWLLPKQATFQAERQLVCESGLPAVCRASVLSFSQLGQLITQQCGGIAIPETSSAGRQMILGHLLRTHQNQLRFFRSVARQPGLTAELDSAFAELERYGKSAEDILSQNEADKQKPIDPGDPLAAKFHDLRLLYDAYTAYLGQDRLDQHRRQSQIIECIREWPGLRDATIYVDGFFDFAQQERRLLAALAQGCASLEITLLLDPSSPILQNIRHRPDAMNLFHRTEQTCLRLMETFRQSEIPVDQPLLLHDAPRSATKTLQFAERHLFDRNAVAGDAFGVHLIEAPSRRTEIDAVARHIRSLLADGLRLRDIAVLARDLNPYHDLIAASFAEHDLPCFIDRRRSAAHHPLVRFTRLLPTLAAGQWPHDTMIGLLKSGLLPATSDQADEIENYVLAHRIRGSAWVAEKPWTLRRSLTKSDDANSTDDQATMERIDSVRRSAVAPLLAFSAVLQNPTPLPIREIVEQIHALFDKAKIRQTLAKWIADANAAGQLEEAAAHEQIWSEITDLLDQMADLLGGEAVTPTEFTDILETGLERFDLALTPPTVDQVLVGAVDRTRTPELKAIILIGWHDGGFPRRPSAGAILSDNDREQMNVGGSTERLLLDERLLAYFAITRSTQHLCITRPCADDTGKILPASPFWSQIERLFPDVTRTIVKRSCDEDCIGTPAQLATALMRWARDSGGMGDPSAPWPALYQWFAMNPAASALRKKSWPALRYHNDAMLSSEIAARLFASPLAGPISRIEVFAACPFKHFAAHGLGLREREEANVTGMDLSRLYHAVLENVVGGMLRAKRDWSDPSPRTAGLIQAQTRSVGQHLRDEIMLSNSRNQYLLQRVEDTLQQVMATQEAAIARGQFRPAKVAFRFGPDAPAGPFSINTPAGNRVELSGTIDRIDIVRSPNTDHIVAMDYRLRADALALDRVYHGLSLQLLTYLLVLQAYGKTRPGRPLTPAAAFYVRLLRQLEDIRHPSDAIGPEDPRFDLQVKPRGILDSEFVQTLDSELVTGPSDVVQVYVNKDGAMGRKNASDAAGPSEFTALLSLVRRRIGEAVDQLLTGDISVKPFRIRQESPCARCDLKSVCRFDTAVNRYRMLEALNREEVMERASKE